MDIGFGRDYGSCTVSIGNSKVITQVSAYVGEPKLTRPSEGIIKIRVDLSMLGRANYDTSKNSDECVQLSRLLQKGIQDARCIDLESLCIIGGQKVWHIQVDISILNHEGNIIQAASMSALSALAHFRRPEVTVEDGKITFHSLDVKESVRFEMLHFPILMKFCFLKGTTFLDPSDQEEKYCDGFLIVGANIFNDITLVQIGGKSLLSKQQIMKQLDLAISNIKIVNQQLKIALDKDELERKKNRSFKGSIYQVLARLH